MAQGVRFDFWDTAFLGVKGLGRHRDHLAIRGSTVPFGDTYYVIRLRHKMWGDRITSGAMFLRKDYGPDTHAARCTTRSIPPMSPFRPATW